MLLFVLYTSMLWWFTLLKNDFSPKYYIELWKFWGSRYRRRAWNKSLASGQWKPTEYENTEMLLIGTRREVSWCMKVSSLGFSSQIVNPAYIGYEIILDVCSVMKQKGSYTGNLSCHYLQGILNDKWEYLAAKAFKPNSDFPLESLGFSVSFFNWLK